MSDRLYLFSWAEYIATTLTSCLSAKTRSYINRFSTAQFVVSALLIDAEEGSSGLVALVTPFPVKLPPVTDRTPSPKFIRYLRPSTPGIFTSPYKLLKDAIDLDSLSHNSSASSTDCRVHTL